MPVHDVAAAAIFALAGVAASFVAVAGRELVRDGRLVTIDAGLSQRVEHTARLMREWAVATATGAD
jgi:hypothetical protein